MVIEKTPPSTGEVAVPEYLPRRGRAKGRVIRVVSWRPGTSWMARVQKSNRKREDLYDFMIFIWFYMIYLYDFVCSIHAGSLTIPYSMIFFNHIFICLQDDDRWLRWARKTGCGEEFGRRIRPNGRRLPDGVISLYHMSYFPIKYIHILYMLHHPEVDRKWHFQWYSLF